jgi:L-lactate dehydrogenase complex protein LldG
MATTSRETILRAARQNSPPPALLPDLDGPWITYPDPVAQFTRVLEAIGGQVVRVSDMAALAETLRQLVSARDSRKTLCGFPELLPSDVDLAQVSDPHQLDDIDLAILPGEFGVAENGAIWVTDRNLPHRVAYFLCQHLALVLPAAEIVHNMHEAYRRIRVEGAGFGVFISGPSKTADIEQSLVIGAHGPKSLTAYFVG